MSSVSVSLLRVVLEEVVCNVLNGVSGTFFGALRHGLQKDRNNRLVEVSAQRQVLKSGVLRSGTSGSRLVYITISSISELCIAKQISKSHRCGRLHFTYQTYSILANFKL